MKTFYKLALASALSAMVIPSVNAAFDDAGTDYTNQTTESYIESGPAGDALNMVDFLLCVMDESKATTNPNSTYSVLVDENVCFGQKKPTPLYASQTLTTSGSSNPTAADPFVVDSWFVTGEGMSVVAKSSISSGATTALPNGVFTMNWKAVSPSSTVGSKGSLSFNADGTMSYIENMTQNAGSTNEFMYVHGTLSADGSTGNLRIKGNGYDSGGKIYPLYRYVFDASHVHYDADGVGGICMDRSAANQTNIVYGYQLFDSAGAKVPLSGPFGFKYTSGSTEFNGWASPHGAWLEGKETNTNKPTIITRRSDSQNFNICYDDDWETASGARYDDADNDNIAGVTVDNANCGTASDGIKLHLLNSDTSAAYTFDAAIAFNAVTFTDRLSGSSVTRTGAKYDGVGSSLDLGWQCLLPADAVPPVTLSDWTTESFTGGNNSCDGAVDFRPLYHLPNGTALVRTSNSATYYVKAIDEKTILKKEASVTPCADLSLATAPADAGYSAASVTDVDLLWSGLPTVTAANTIKYIHGVAQ
jgi:hypothetical protein